MGIKLYSKRKKLTSKILAVVVSLSMVMPLAPALPASADSSALDLTRTAVFGVGDGNIGPLATASPAANGSSPTTINDNARQGNASCWNTWGKGTPFEVYLEWDKAYEIDAMRIQWAVYSDGGVRWPRQAHFEYRDLKTDEWVYGGPIGTGGNNANFTGTGGASANKPWPVANNGGWGRNDIWNVFRFDGEPYTVERQFAGTGNTINPEMDPAQTQVPEGKTIADKSIYTDQVRLVVLAQRSSGTAPGFGIGEWEVFGTDNPARADVEEFSEDFLKGLVMDAALPSTGSNGSQYTWSDSTDPASFGNDGKVTRPALGGSEVTGTIKLTSVNGTNTATREFNWSVKPIASDADSVAWDLDAIDLGTITDRIENFTLPSFGEWGSDISWTSSEPDYLWEDGKVVRPPEGSDVTVTLTATATYGTVTDTREWNVTIPAFPEATGRRIDRVRLEPEGDYLEDSLIEVPEGSSPSLPYRVWVEYSDGHAEWRNTKWPWQAGGGRSSTNQSGPGNGPPAEGSWVPYNIEDEWRGYTTGKEYTVTGWITGSGTSTLGHPITVNCEVVSVAKWEADNIPSNTVAADQLPPGKVTLTGANRLTANSRASIERTVGYSPDTYLWNYRDTFGLQQPAGVTAPGGWENATTMLRGHGVGHYLSSMALAYGSGLATQDQLETLRNNMKYMIETMRDIQELTFVPVPNTHPNAAKNGGSGYREASNIWPVYPADKERMAPDWPYPLLSEITTASKNTDDNGRYARITGRYWNASQIPTTGEVWDPTKTPDPSKTYIGAPKTGGTGSVSPQGETFNLIPSEKGNPEWFGYGYLNAIPPQHPAIGEAYRGYSSWQWAPYYGIHKQLAGLLEIYYLFQNDPDPELKAIGEKALQICKDMSHWVSDRLTKTCRNEETRATNWYGNLNNLWFINISGEYGGANESIARAAYALKDGDPDKELLIKGSEMFKNRSYWEPLISNTEIMSYDGNSHANSRIPNFPGVLWSYRGNDDPDYYKMAKNFFSFNAGRYRYWTGNVGTGEWYKTPYQQIATIQNVGMETCCSYNLARLSKDLACFEPDNAEYMDYYERLMYNQLVGSLAQDSWRTTYQYYLGPGTGSDWRGTTPGNDCCGGTGAENHVRYTDSIYLINNGGKDTIWVNMYIPSTVTWDASGVTLEQEGEWPGQNYKINVKQNAGQTAKPFDMKLRVPWWATKDFDIKLNGTSIAADFTPSTYVTINNVSLTDEVEVICPFGTSIDYAPDKSGDHWAGVFFYGPLSMSSLSSDWSVVDVESNLSNIEESAAEGITDRADRPGNNRNVYSMTVKDTDQGAQPTTNATDMLTSWYNVANRPSGIMHYFKINLLNEGGDREPLYTALLATKVYKAEDFTPASFADLQNIFNTALAMYQDEGVVQFQMEEQISLLKAGIDQLVPTDSAYGKGDLLSIINAAKEERKKQEAWNALPDGDPNKNAETKPWAPYGYEIMLEKLAEAQHIFNNSGFTLGEINAALNTLKGVMDDKMRPGYQPEVEDLVPLTELIKEAKAILPNDYSAGSFAALQEAITVAEAEEGYIVNGSSTINWKTIPDAMEALQRVIDSLEYANPVTGVVLDRIMLALKVGDSATLTASVSPANATNSKVIFRSSDAEIAEVDETSGEVTGVAPGRTVITVSTVDGGKIANCEVVVGIRTPEDAAADAAKAAEAAQAAAEAARAEAEAARAEAEALKADVEAGKEVAEAAEARAIEAEKKAEVADAKASAAQATANALQASVIAAAATAAAADAKAEAAQTAAAAADARAAAAAATAAAAAAKAEAAETKSAAADERAVAAAIAATEANTRAEAAQTAANQAKTVADAAELKATAAQTAADNAMTMAQSANAAATAAQTAAAIADAKAEAAAAQAAAAQAAANAADAKAAAAQATANAAQASAATAISMAAAADAKAAAAQATADAAEARAIVAQEKADKATADAAKAAEDAKKASDDAKKAAEDAKKAAADAQKAIEDAAAARKTADQAAADAKKAAEERDAARLELAAAKAAEERDAARLELAAAKAAEQKNKAAMTIMGRTTKVSSAKSPKKGRIVVKLKKDSLATGYQIQWSTKSSFKKGTKKNTNKASYTIKSLKKGRKYYVRARAFTKDAKGKTVYGQWSKAKQARVKK